MTRSDFDGLVCAVLLRQLDLVDEITFVHPKDVQDGAVEITSRDILTNLPYDPRAHLVFDHHHSETLRNAGATNHVIDPEAPSAARVVFDHYGGAARFPKISDDLMRAVDQADSAAYSIHEVLEPTGWTLLNFLMDSRTGLGRFRDFRISNYQLMMQLIDICIDYQDVEEILALPDVAERVELYRAQAELFHAQLERVTTVHGDVAVLDLREEEVIHAGNRFYVYAMFPQARVSMHVLWGKAKQNTVFAIGKSIVDRTSPVDVGAVCLEHGGGGHVAAGTCQVPHEDSERVLAELVERLRAER
ncbi:exopolyphosphatase [Kineococcus sp. T13]|nr:exopolyphosphatase [Kineococcus vitellinus]